MKLFIYGLLRPGFEGAKLLGNARSLGEATTQGWLYDLGGYPGLVAGDGIVHGEVCEVDDARLPEIDAFEQYDPADPAGSLYVRDVFTARQAETGEALSVQAYRYNRQPLAEGWIPSGDYRSGARHED
ncbi:gamma-glutamylcyclotransferase family protein [Spiribacter vilamensis]|uniref:Gamma-glutamylcyclotransferase (GGCT)/AIG2-like uncharacterized protein YtfP n=1 Tax=Spiribacter vilamensis TaxID=531306 RepID=A0A4Q8D0B6_9GAMM|nr:gamma-glutamylcyclotransferase family protein [Spiribacter vilamensis]RZU98749.1 gamma-glutamylcyclotransferase (GGCT)/AIG2-like uncharacterized protein YtfP [Spiribacter vilamensis]TVO62228.1 gamma-glutamylcyclotransferase [Spiribacter vilamensis]